MLYKCKRSANVISTNYCTCARLDRANYNELVKIYPVLNDYIKADIIKYDDPLKIFLELSLNRIDFFKGLSRQIKNEWIFLMKKRTYD